MKFKLVTILIFLFAIPAILWVRESGNIADAAAGVQLNVNFVWTLIAAILVFLMQAGFAMLESGLTRAKNTVNIMMKNLMDFSIGTLAFWLVGFGLMFGTNVTGWIGLDGFMLSDYSTDGDPWTLVFWMFQVVFAATAATIVSGAMAERTKFIGYLIYSVILTALIYPVFGSWAWGGLFHGSGWLEELGFIDFAGSTVVHSIGGWAALAGTIVLGPRIGKFSNQENPRLYRGITWPTSLWEHTFYGLDGSIFNAGSTTAGTTDIAL